MSDRKEHAPTQLGIFDKAVTGQVTGIEVVALVLSVLWLAGTALFFLLSDPGSDPQTTGGAGQFLMIMLAIFMPVAMIWVAATAARASRVMREESARLQSAIDGIRHAYIAQNQSRNTMSEPTVVKKLDEIAAAQRKTETTLAVFSSTRPSEPARYPTAQVKDPLDEADQVSLPLGTSMEELQPPLERQDFIRALNFPETADDKKGFAALRKALKDRSAGQLIQASQDVLTLMSHDGIYMDDLHPDMARSEIWRRFADGERGRSIAALGGVRDRSSLALTAARMKSDTIFRDTSHHFLRLFDRMFTQFAETASDAEISELSDTRTARAFMLLGRVAGTFD